MDFEAWSKKVEVQLRNELPAREVDDLMDEHVTEPYDNIFVGYHEFPYWLERFDKSNTRKFPVNVRSYRFQRERHQREVKARLDEIAGQRIGHALMREIKRLKTHTLVIRPYFRWNMHPTQKFPAFPGGMNAYARPEELEKAVPQGVPFRAGKRVGVGVGTGTNVELVFTPHMFGPFSSDPTTHTSTGTAGPMGFASNPDEVLYHEMVHACRQMRGVLAQWPVTEGYTDEEEYLAVVLSNIYLAEKGQKLFRSSHATPMRALPRPQDFLKNPQNVSLSPKKLLLKFRDIQRDFFDDLARIPQARAWWNPVRELDQMMRKPGFRP